MRGLGLRSAQRTAQRMGAYERSSPSTATGGRPGFQACSAGCSAASAPATLEPATRFLEGSRSVQLSYGGENQEFYAAAPKVGPRGPTRRIAARLLVRRRKQAATPTFGRTNGQTRCRIKRCEGPAPLAGRRSSRLIGESPCSGNVARVVSWLTRIGHASNEHGGPQSRQAVPAPHDREVADSNRPRSSLISKGPYGAADRFYLGVATVVRERLPRPVVQINLFCS
jgi:hypothetical protein